MGGSTRLRMLEMLSVYNEIGTYRFHKVREGRETFDAEDAALTGDFTESFGGKLHFIDNNCPGRPTAHHMCTQHPSSVSLPFR